MPRTEPALVMSPAFSELIGSAQRATGRSNHRSKNAGNCHSVRKELVRERAVMGRSDIQREVCSTGVSRTIRTLPYLGIMLSVETPATLEFRHFCRNPYPAGLPTPELSVAQPRPLHPFDSQSRDGHHLPPHWLGRDVIGTNDRDRVDNKAV